MANAATPFGFSSIEGIAKRRRDRPDPLRTYSQPQVQVPEHIQSISRSHSRRKSTTQGTTILRTKVKTSSEQLSPQSPHFPTVESRSRPGSRHASVSFAAPPANPLTPPTSPKSAGDDEDMPELLSYDFTTLDYELERAKVLGSGLWSTVYLAYSRPAAVDLSEPSAFTPPTTPSKPRTTAASSLYAVKVPARQDAKDVLLHEAKALTHLQSHLDAEQFVVRFEGLDERNSALVFEAALGGSLENMNSRLKQLTDVARHRELVSSFPGLAFDLVSGLAFIHSCGIVHADIKPANILLDIDQSTNTSVPTIRARYIDFSAAFEAAVEDCPKYAGGTWDFMAPEQMRIQKDLNTPTFASDVWSLGITLLSLILGGSPYTAACGGNLFMLREAIKNGDPLSFARMDPTCQTRIAASQDFIDCCRLALKKDRDIRVTSAAWRSWLENHELWTPNQW